MEIILHIGAHRTGSTAVERTLSGNAETLARHGVQVWSPEKLREMEEFAPPRDGLDDAARAAFAATVAGAGAQVLVISEENMIGSMRENVKAGKFYPKAFERLSHYAALMPEIPKRIGLGIRDYPGYWASIYAYQLSARALPAWEDLAPLLPGARRGWRDLVGDVRAAFPESEIMVWPMHALRGRVVDIAARLIGRDRNGLTPIRRAVNASPGADAIPLLMQLRADNPEATREEMIALCARHPTPEPGSFTAFPREDVARMAARYSAEMAELKSGFCGVEFVEREPAGAA